MHAYLKKKNLEIILKDNFILADRNTKVFKTEEIILEKPGDEKSQFYELKKFGVART